MNNINRCKTTAVENVAKTSQTEESVIDNTVKDNAICQSTSVKNVEKISDQNSNKSNLVKDNTSITVHNVTKEFDNGDGKIKENKTEKTQMKILGLRVEI